MISDQTRERWQAEAKTMSKGTIRFLQMVMIIPCIFVIAVKTLFAMPEMYQVCREELDRREKEPQ